MAKQKIKRPIISNKAISDILNSGALRDALDFEKKYLPEDSVYRADQTRINDAISNLTRERFPEFEKARMSASGQFLANESKRNLVEGEQREAKRNFLGALRAAGKTKGGLRGLASLLGKQSDIESKIAAGGRRDQRTAAQAAQQEQRTVSDYNRSLGDQAKIYDFMKKRDVDALESERTRVKGLYGDTRARKMADIMAIINKRRGQNASQTSKINTTTNLTPGAQGAQTTNSLGVGKSTINQLASYGPNSGQLNVPGATGGARTPQQQAQQLWQVLQSLTNQNTGPGIPYRPQVGPVAPITPLYPPGTFTTP